ncbi:hypothetical protein OG851_26840 [Streptomyces sp. NBC_00161]
MLIVSSIGFDNSVLRRQASAWSDRALWAIGAALMLTVFLSWWRHLPSARPPFTPEHWRDEVLLNRRASTCAWTTLLLSGLLAVASGIAVGIPYELWLDMPHWLVYALGEAGLLIPGAVIVTAVRSLPRA